MNIFHLHKNPEICASYHCDKHVVKMILETGQMLSTAYQRHCGLDEQLYKPAYPKHPMTIWVGDNRDNINWAYQNANCIGQEYFKRFNKIHKSSKVLLNIAFNDHKNDIPKGDMTPPPHCMPDQYKLRSDLYVNAYRDFYKGEKEYFAKWEKDPSRKPTWWKT
mgnify:CR=1 FL=1